MRRGSLAAWLCEFERPPNRRQSALVVFGTSAGRAPDRSRTDRLHRPSCRYLARYPTVHGSFREFLQKHVAVRYVPIDPAIDVVVLPERVKRSLDIACPDNEHGTPSEDALDSPRQRVHCLCLVRVLTPAASMRPMAASGQSFAALRRAVDGTACELRAVYWYARSPIRR
jgi:hypothetical protein